MAKEIKLQIPEGKCGSHLALKSRELALYASKQFTKEYVDFLFNFSEKEVNNG